MPNLEQRVPVSLGRDVRDSASEEKKLISSYMSVNPSEVYDCGTCNNCGSGDCASCCSGSDD